MKKISCIVTATFQPHLLRHLLLQLGQSRRSSGTCRASNERWSAAATASVESCTKGKLLLRNDDAATNLSFAARFLFTGMDRQNGGAATVWRQSLS